MADHLRTTKECRGKNKLVHATMLLATAICWATSYRTSILHAAQYMICMVAYLNTLKDLYPNLAWRPNHHATLYIGPFLLLFGPMHSWWMFVFKRVIGKLQKLNTNYKLGELGVQYCTKCHQLMNELRRDGGNYARDILCCFQFQVVAATAW